MVLGSCPLRLPSATCPLPVLPPGLPSVPEALYSPAPSAGRNSVGGSLWLVIAHPVMYQDTGRRGNGCFSIPPLGWYFRDWPAAPSQTSHRCANRLVYVYSEPRGTIKAKQESWLEISISCRPTLWDESTKTWKKIRKLDMSVLKDLLYVIFRTVYLRLLTFW